MLRMFLEVPVGEKQRGINKNRTHRSVHHREGISGQEEARWVGVVLSLEADLPQLDHIFLNDAPVGLKRVSHTVMNVADD